MDGAVRMAPRMRSLRLCDSPPSSFVRRLADHGLANLEELTLLDQHLPNSAKSFFGPTPRLWKLDACPHLIEGVGMPWLQLTDLTLRHCKEPLISLEILIHCKNLVAASVLTCGWIYEPPLRGEILLNHLRTLLLDLRPANGETCFTPFLTRLSVPALEELALRLVDRYSWVETHVTSFQLRSPNITHLEVTSNHGLLELTSDEVRIILLRAPSLTCLVFHHCVRGINDALLRALLYKDGVEPLVPRLHDLSLLGIHPLKITVLEDMIVSRWNSGSPAVARWKRIQLKPLYPFAFSKNFCMAMKALARQGIPVVL
ncbi:hypothetical protein MVEN_01496000 [Mycena venus]|uniref:F-box domain-containing protein n=1 Tax=Mycena venus TaxID=2733690 RepID=A0A8H6XUF8_9AGAR|nr:hypothetical protein MVEN_01496000 [Mycena venus]